MSLYGSISLHANNTVVVLLNDQDQGIYQKRLPHHLPMILEPLSLHRGEIEGVVVESTYGRESSMTMPAPNSMAKIGMNPASSDVTSHTHQLTPRRSP